MHFVSAPQVPKGTSTHSPASFRSACTAALTSFAAVFLPLFIFWWVRIRGLWTPDGDEFPLITDSAVFYRPNPLRWFTEGYRNYLIVYPDISVPRSNFLRPVANIKYFLESIIFGHHYDRYLLTNYIVFAMISGIATYIGVRWFRFRPWQWLVVTALLFMSPGMDVLASVYPNSCLDIIASLLVLLTYCCILERKYLPALIAISAAVFTKETSHFAPFAAIALLLFLERKPLSLQVRRYLFLFPLPVLALYGLRYFAFRNTKGPGVYIAGQDQSLTHAAVRAFTGLRKWPLHAYTLDFFTNITGKTDNPWTARGIAFGCLAFWLVFACTVILVGRSWYCRKRPANNSILPDESLKRFAALLLFFIGSMTLPIVLNLGSRFGMVGFPFFILSALAAINLLRSRKLLVSGWSISLIALFALSVPTRVSVYKIAVERPDHWRMNQSYIDTARSAPPGLLLIVDDATGFDAGTQWFQKFIGFSGTIVRVNDILIGNISCYAPSILWQESPGEVKIVFPRRPECSSAMVRAVEQGPPLEWHREVNGLVIDYKVVPMVGFVSAIIRVPANVTPSIMISDPKRFRYRLLSPREISKM